MPRIVPVSDFRADIKAVSSYTDQGEVVILTQNGHPRWAMVDYDEWNEAARVQERSFAKALRQTEAKEAAGRLEELDASEARARLRAHREGWESA